jgi:DNA/RNA endonuclease YhcR with UshA esterase domain
MTVRKPDFDLPAPGESAMRAPTVLLALVFAPAAVADDTPAKALAPAEAAKKVNEKVTVEMEVKSTGGRSNRYLNSEPDYKSHDNFTVFIAKEVLPKFKEAKIDDPADYYKGKTIRVTGTVTVYDGEPRIEIEDPDQIKVVEKK